MHACSPHVETGPSPGPRDMVRRTWYEDVEVVRTNGSINVRFSIHCLWGDKSYSIYCGRRSLRRFVRNLGDVSFQDKFIL